MIVSNLKKQLNGKNIINDISFSLSDGNKVGLVGLNGSGKTTLLRILSADLKVDSGTINYDSESVGYLKQEIPFVYNDLSIIDYIKKETGIDKLEKILHELENNLDENNMDMYGDILNQYLAIDGYMFDDNLKNILGGLHFQKDLNCKIKLLSGGEKIKILLSTLLLENKDILLLDEPTNNLDIEAIEWLENYLKSINKKIIIVSHDEEFLNNIVNRIFELKDGKLNEYNLSYNEYLIRKKQEYEKQKEEYLKAQDQKIKLKKQVQKAKEWASKGNSKKNCSDNDKIANNYAVEKTNMKNISKLTKSLQNLEIPDFEEQKPIKVFFEFDNSKGNKDIILENLVCGYDNFKTPQIDLIIPFGTRIMISGGNGTGKTTLIKTILKQISPLIGSVKIGNDARIGYISQNTLEEKNDLNIYEYITNGELTIEKSQIFVLLNKFNIDYNDRNKLYSSLSPGERTRINLVKLALNKINVLILDEVTNHLDKEALDLIYELVEDYGGTIISISHNRKYNEYLNASIDLNIENGEIKQNVLHKFR